MTDLLKRRVVGPFVVVSAAVCTYAMRRADPDLWGYLTYGRLIVDQGHLTSRDVFAYTSSGAHWVTFEYLAHILLWFAYSTLGTIGLIATKCVIGGAALYWVYAALRDSTGSARIWVPVFAFSASTVSRFFLFRPQLFTFAFFAYFVAVVIRFLRRGDAQLWILPIVMLVWAKSHGGFLAGLGAVGLAILLRTAQNLGDRPIAMSTVMRGTRPLWLTLLGCTLATLVNPQGWRLWQYVLTEIAHGTNRQYIAEWRPASLTSGDVWSALALVAVAGLLLAGGWIASRHGSVPTSPRPTFWVLSCLPIVAMSFMSIRHVPIAVIWAAPIVAILWTAGAEDAPQRWRRTWATFSAAALGTVYLVLIVVWVQPLPIIAEGGSVLGSRHPCRVTTFLRLNKIAGNVYNPLWWGSYLTWTLYPDVRVSMDGRNISLFPDAMVTENLRFYSASPEAIDLDTPLRYDSDFMLAPSDMPALSRLEHDARWHRIFADRDAVLFVRASPAHGRVIAAAQRGQLAQPPEQCAPTL